MKKVFLMMSLALMAVLVMSCTNEDLTEEVNENFVESSSHRLTAEQAAQNVMNFVSKVNGTTRSASKQIAEVKAISMPGVMTRSGSGELFNLDSLFYVVNFTDNQGFAVAAADDRETPVYAYIEDGNYSGYSSDEDNPGFDAFMNALIEQEIYERFYDQGNGIGEGGDDDDDDDDEFPQEDETGGGGGVYLPDRFIVQSPLLVTKWGQGYFNNYNMYCPDGSPTGCVVTAMAQICSYLESPNSVNWAQNGTFGGSPLDWPVIKLSPYPYGESQNQVAHLMRFLGVAFNADYSSDGTSVDSGDAIDAMRNFGHNVSNLTDYDAINVVETLSQGNRIIFMRGNARYYHVAFVFRRYVDGHAWVVDGYIDQVENRERSIYVHCNWGWDGQKNGYFLSSVLNAEQNPVFDDNGTRSQNYRYRLKTATFVK